MIYLILCAILQGFSKSISDTLQFHYSSSIFSESGSMSFFGVDSWKRKYKNGDVAQGEKFPLSTSLFVFLTDGWHCTNTIQIFSQLAGFYIALNLNITPSIAIYYCLGYWIIRTIVFHIFFTYLLKSKNHVSTH